MEEIEQRAEAVLAGLEGWIWDGEQLPVPVNDIASDRFGLHVREMSPAEMAGAPGAPPLAPRQSLSGLLLAGPGEIWVNADEAREWPGRRRFTIAHELGHYCMHRRRGRESLFCRHGAVDPEKPTKRPAIEAEADAFSAALTMPADLVQTHYERLCREDDCFERLCRLFGASGAAMGRRLHAVI